jgi:hypothetical protein
MAPNHADMVAAFRGRHARLGKRRVSLFPAVVTDHIWGQAGATNYMARNIPREPGQPDRSYGDILTRAIALLGGWAHWTNSAANAIQSLVVYIARAGGLAEADATTILTEANMNPVFLHFKRHFGDVFNPGGREHITRAQFTTHMMAQNNRRIDTFDPANDKVMRWSDNVDACWHMLNNAITIQREHHENPYMNLEQGQFFYDQLIFTMADTGTKEDGSIMLTTPLYYRINVGDSSVTVQAGFGAIRSMANIGTLLRRFARANCNAAANIGRVRGHQYLPGIEHGMPYDLGYLGFDFADVYKSSSSREQVAIRQAKDAGLFKESTAQRQLTNANVRYQREGQVAFGGIFTGR